MIPVRLPWRLRARPSATLHEIQGPLQRADLSLMIQSRAELVKEISNGAVQLRGFSRGMKAILNAKVFRAGRRISREPKTRPESLTLEKGFGITQTVSLSADGANLPASVISFLNGNNGCAVTFTGAAVFSFRKNLVCPTWLGVLGGQLASESHQPYSSAGCSRRLHCACLGCLRNFSQPGRSSPLSCRQSDIVEVELSIRTCHRSPTVADLLAPYLETNRNIRTLSAFSLHYSWHRVLLVNIQVAHDAVQPTRRFDRSKFRRFPPSHDRALGGSAPICTAAL